MAIALKQAIAVGGVRDEAAIHGQEAVSARAHARTAVPLQPGLQRLRQDPTPGRDPAPAPLAREVLRSRRRVRRPGGRDPGRRAAAPPADSRNRGRPRRTKEICLPVHERAAARSRASTSSRPRTTSASTSTSTDRSTSTTRPSPGPAPSTSRSARSARPRPRASASTPTRRSSRARSPKISTPSSTSSPTS